MAMKKNERGALIWFLGVLAVMVALYLKKEGVI